MMMTIRCSRLLFMAATASLALSGCRPSPQAPSAPDDQAKADAKRLVYLAASNAHVFELAQQQTLAFLAGKSKTIVLESHDAQDQAAAQNRQWHEANAARPFAIIVDAVDPEGLAPLIADAVRAGTLVIGLGTDMRDTGCSTVVWCDQRELGKLAGQMVVRALTIRAQEDGRPEVTGRVVEIRGNEESNRCLERHAGFVEALRAAPGLILVHDAPGYWTREGGLQRTQDALRLQKQFDVVYAHNDLMAFGAAQAAGPSRESMLFIGTDAFGGPTGGMTLVGNGDIDATIFQPLLVDLAWTIVRKKAAEPAFKPKPDYQVTPRTVSAKDIDDIRRNGLPKFPEL